MFMSMGDIVVVHLWSHSSRGGWTAAQTSVSDHHNVMAGAVPMDRIRLTRCFCLRWSAFALMIYLERQF